VAWGRDDVVLFDRWSPVEEVWRQLAARWELYVIVALIDEWTELELVLFQRVGVGKLTRHQEDLGPFLAMAIHS
jgi:hypothetical protein